MRRDWVIWFAAVLLFASGAVAALLATGSEVGHWLFAWITADESWAKDSFELLSYFSTTVLAVVAVVTIYAWRHQFVYTKRHDAFIKLNIALQDLDVFRIWAAAFRDSFVRRYKKNTDDQVDIDTADFVLELERRMPEVWKSYRLAVYEAALYMSAHDLEPSLHVPHVKEKLLSKVQDLQRNLSEYHGRQLTPEDWQQMSVAIELTCGFVQSDCQKIIEAGERYIFRQLRPSA